MPSSQEILELAFVRSSGPTWHLARTFNGRSYLAKTAYFSNTMSIVGLGQETFYTSYIGGGEPVSCVAYDRKTW